MSRPRRAQALDAVAAAARSYVTALRHDETEGEPAASGVGGARRRQRRRFDALEPASSPTPGVPSATTPRHLARRRADDHTLHRHDPPARSR